jgi:predicted nucleotidyltransferase
MVQIGDINAWCGNVVREFRPDRIVLFGSFANGTPTDDSDVDLLIVMPLAKGGSVTCEWRRQFGNVFGLLSRWMSLYAHHDR